jgi:hypothetical protein
MEISEFAFRALLLFFPGIICALVVNALTVHRERKPFDLFLLSFVFGVAAYFEYWVIARTIGPWLSKTWGVGFPPDFVFLRALQDKSVKLSYLEIALVCVTSLLQGLIVATADSYKLFHRIARWLKITKRSGELDVWGFTFNSPNIQFATIRDLKNDLIYDGWIQSFSDDAKTSELLLRDVAVFRNSDGNLLYSVGAIYLCVEQKNTAIEFRDVPLTQAFQQQNVRYHEQRGTTTSSSAASAAAGFERRNREEGGSESAADQRAPTRAASTTAFISPQETVGVLAALGALAAVVWLLRLSRRP